MLSFISGFSFAKIFIFASVGWAPACRGFHAFVYAPCPASVSQWRQIEQPTIVGQLFAWA